MASTIGESDRGPCSEAAGYTERGSDPDGGGRRQSLHPPRFGIAQDHPGTDEADPAHHPLDDALNHPAECIWVGRYSLDVRSCQGNDRRRLALPARVSASQSAYWPDRG